MERKIRIVHYLNQFFGQEGGEDKADMGFIVKDGPIGPGVLLQKLFGDEAEVSATVICGDNYFSGDTTKAVDEGLKIIAELKPDIFFSGPAFHAGRYGVACGAIAHAVQEKLCIPAITGMYIENPAVDIHRKYIYIVETGINAGSMNQSMNRMVSIGRKLLNKEPIGHPAVDGYISRGFLKNECLDQTGAVRAVDMLLAKINKKEFKTEIELPVFENIEPAQKVKDIKKATIALVTDGGLVPKGNPDRFKVSQNEVFAAYNIENFISNPFSVSHSGYHHSDVRKDINRLMPFDVMKEFVEEGKIKSLLPIFYSTSGNTVPVKTANKIGMGIAEKLKAEGVDAVILTST